MSRFGSFWIGLAIVSGVTNYGLKQMVQGTANDLAAVQRKTAVEQKEIHELQADWTFLNQPELLADLNKRHVGLMPLTPKQAGVSIDSIPLRPVAPPPPDAAAPQIAAAAPAAAPLAADVVALDPPATATPVSAAGPAPISPAAATPAPPPIIRAVATAASAPVVRVAANAPARAAPAPAAAAAPAPASLDALFAQVAGDR